jgi:hypothetical protein
MTVFEPDTDELRLESWKAIAAYLNRDVRTAKRWEAHEGLPIRRQHHLVRSSVYAYPREIDQWREQRKPRAAPSRRLRIDVERRWLLLAGCVAGAMVAGGGGHFSGPMELSAQARSLTAVRLLTGLAVSGGRARFETWVWDKPADVLGRR